MPIRVEIVIIETTRRVILTIKREGIVMKKLNLFWLRYGTPNNLKLAYILLTLVALAVAGGAPCGGSEG